jgi:dimeric dUTPase (all-alpha-NTP-PPase superfamily)
MDIEKMFQRQADLQVNSFGITPWLLEGPDRREYVAAMSLALQDELSEALREIAWKPWAQDDYVNQREFLGELVDLFHFLMNLALIVDPTGDAFVEAYFKKAEVNAKRQARGYSVLDKDAKCEHCGRALDEPR